MNLKKDWVKVLSVSVPCPDVFIQIDFYGIFYVKASCCSYRVRSNLFCW